MRVSGEQVINLDPATTFSLFSDIESSGAYSKPVIERRKLTDGPTGIGTKYLAVDQWPGKRVEFTVELTAFEEPARLAARWSEPMAGGWEARFQPEGAGTRLSFTASMEPGGIMRFLSPVMRPWAQRQTRDFLRSFKAWAEARAAGS
jgi:hypothetical protein